MWISLEIISYLTAQLINFKKFHSKEILIFGDSSAAREGYDQQLGAQISQQGHGLDEIIDNHKDDGEKNNVY